MSAITYPQATKQLSAQTNEKIDAALKVDWFSTNYRIEFQPEEAREFVRRADAYNNFTRDDLVHLIDRVNAHIPTMQYAPGNPNNGRTFHHFLIGNEGSRVVYVQLAKAYLKDFNYAKLTATLKAIGKSAHADEISEHENNAWEYMFRFWWD